MKGTRRAHQSAYVIKDAIFMFYEDAKLFPRGLQRNLECVDKWGTRMGGALKRLAAGLNTILHSLIGKANTMCQSNTQKPCAISPS